MGYGIPITNIGVVIFYAAIFTFLEAVRFDGMWDKVLMDIMPAVLVAAWCIGQISWIIVWWWAPRF